MTNRSQREFKYTKKSDGRLKVEVDLRGRELLNHPSYNKGSAFTKEERIQFGIDGLLPPHVSTLEEQSRRNYGSIARKGEPLEKYIGLVALQGRNESLFYRLLLDHLEEFLPIVYTPTVGLACQCYSHIFRRAQGVWITPDDSGRIHEVLRNSPFKDIKLIVVTDNERILGLGDQGAGGMGIPIGKLSLYTVAAGFHPTQTLPVSLDVGTDNGELLNDSLYLGWRHRRLRGKAYDDLVAEFVDAVKMVFPHALLQWEDFKKANALRLLDKYRHTILSFNDDIQGTAAIALACMLSATRLTKKPIHKQRIVILGAGAAGVGIGRLIQSALKDGGVEKENWFEHLAVLDSNGLVCQQRTDLDSYKSEFAWPDHTLEKIGLSAKEPADLLEVVTAFKPDVLIGTSGQPGVFNEKIIREMAKHTEKPVIFPFSNPTSNSEATPSEILDWTDGKAIIATGSPFDPVSIQGKQYHISQGNNVYIFPGVGLGAIAARCKFIPEELFVVAAKTVAEAVDEALLKKGLLLPPVDQLRDIARKIAVAVGEAAVANGWGSIPADKNVINIVDELMWKPDYPELVPR